LIEKVFNETRYNPMFLEKRIVFFSSNTPAESSETSSQEKEQTFTYPTQKYNIQP
jgi:hypothetical protein